MDDPPPLPEIYQQDVDRATIAQLLRDLAEAADIERVHPRSRRRQQTAGEAELGLDEAVERLLAGELVGLQLTYRFEGKRWRDTIMRLPEGFRLVRIEAQGPDGGA